MIRRVGGYLTSREPESAPAESLELEREGATVLRGVWSLHEVSALAEEIAAVYDRLPPDARAKDARPPELDQDFRYEMLNRSGLAQQAIGHRRILGCIEPLLGEDCHVIANTAWRNPPRPEDRGQPWHIDAGPHVPLPDGVRWPDEIPHPVFAVGVHIFLRDCSLEDGPTGVIPGSHRSGRFPPMDRIMDPDLEHEGRGMRPLLAAAGDVAMFVSDVWHRRLPSGPRDRGRFFLQVHYGRRDIAQRIRTTAEANSLSAEAIARAGSQREQTLIGLHAPFFYDG